MKILGMKMILGMIEDAGDEDTGDEAEAGDEDAGDDDDAMGEDDARGEDAGDENAGKWRMNNGDVDLTNDRYSMVGGNLVINNPDKQKDAGIYYCLASNNYGMVRSTEATLSFGYLDPFPPEERPEVKVKEGKGMVLLCDPPYHFPDDLSYRWLLNEFPVFITMDKRRFVSQTNGNLYIANVEASDRGNYSCFVSSPSITKSVFSKFIPLIPIPERTTKPYPADIVVQFKDIYTMMGQNVTLECFALGNPVPDIRWRKVLEPMPSTAEISTSGAVLKIFNIQLEDEGIYECEAENIRGKDKHQAKIYVQAFPEWVEHINDTEVDIGSDLYWPCVATGKPIPTIRWLKNGYPLDANGELLIRNAQLKHAGRYTCTAQTIVDNSSASADLVVRVSAEEKWRVTGPMPIVSASLLWASILGPPGPPGGLRIEDIRATSVALTWSRGSDNHSPISKYTIQTKTILSDDWKDAKTDPPIIEGNMEAAKAVDLIPWMEYEFRVVATNTLVAFKPFDGEEWKKVTVTNPDTGRYVHKDETMTPSTAFQVKVKAFNNKGDGPYSLIAVINSAQDAPSEAPTEVGVKVLSSSEISVHWKHVLEKIVESYQIRYWAAHDKEAAAHRVQVTSQEYSARLENLLPDTQYFIEVGACNSAGCGPSSDVIEAFTRKAPPSQPPRIISSVRSGSRYIITWDHVVALSNESTVTGYKEMADEMSL
ncbi:hypothetical protein NN561_002173 [Cricetulus griseus]